MAAKTQQITASDGTQLFRQAWEPADFAATVCLVHGLGEHSSRYAHVAEAFAAENIAVHAFDLRGHGKSEGKRGHTPSLQQWLADVQLLIEQSDVDKPRFLYGHSLGGLIALRFGLQPSIPLRGVIASGPALRRSFEVPAIKTLLARGMARVLPSFSQPSGLDPEAISRDKSIVEAYINDPLVHDLASAQLFIEATRAGEETLAQAAAFDLPLLLVCGQEDTIIDVSACEAFFEMISSEDKTLRVLPDLYHEVHNEPEKAAVIQEIIQWVNKRI
jgi:alpha-beta hydrolase superfamily lysophospholipase